MGDVVRKLMAFVRALATCAAIAYLVVVGVQKASTHPTWGPILKPYLDVLSAAVSPTPTSGGAEAARERQLVKVERVSKEVGTTKVYTYTRETLPPELRNKKWEVGRVTVRHDPPITVCSPGGAYFVPPEVFGTGAVCDDPSLGVPLKDAQRLSYDELWARVNAIRDHYLAQKQHKN